jgi:hypothetical protein
MVAARGQRRLVEQVEQLRFPIQYYGLSLIADRLRARSQRMSEATILVFVLSMLLGG